MRDIEQAIERFEGLIKLLNGYKTETNSGTLLDENLQAYNLAIEVLKEKQARENQKPLTLEQLRAREGKPVYSKRCGWGIVGKNKMWDKENNPIYKIVIGYPYGWEWLEDVLKSGALYDHEPKEV